MIQKSKNISKVQDWFEKLKNHENEENSTENPELPDENSEKKSENSKKENKDDDSATLIGFVAEVRHIPTKSGQMMIIALVQSAGFDFRVIIFGRDFELYKDKIREDTIIIATGKLRFDEERGEVSLSPAMSFAKNNEKPMATAIKTFSISQFQNFAKSQGFHPTSEPEKKRFDIALPPFWTAEDSLELKKFLENEKQKEAENDEHGDIEIFLTKNNAEKSTKFFLASTENLEKWLKSYV